MDADEPRRTFPKKSRKMGPALTRVKGNGRNMKRKSMENFENSVDDNDQTAYGFDDKDQNSDGYDDDAVLITTSFSDEEQSSNAIDSKTTPDFRQEIANMPLGKAKKLKDKLGLRLFNKVFFADSRTAEDVLESNAQNRDNFKRDNPKRPREMSSKRPVSKFRNVLENERIEKKRFDPRFDERCGAFDEHIYNTNFGFLDELRKNEKQMLKKEIKSVELENPDKAAKMKETYRKIVNREQSLGEAKMRKEVISEIRRENNERLRQGLKPIFRTRAEIKKRFAEKKFAQLKKNGKLNKYMERKAKSQNKKNSIPL